MLSSVFTTVSRRSSAFAEAPADHCSLRGGWSNLHARRRRQDEVLRDTPARSAQLRISGLRPAEMSGERGALVGVGGFVRVIGTAHERPGFDVDESQVERDSFEIAELVGMVVANHRGVLRRGS